MLDNYAIGLKGRSIFEIISEADIIVQLVSLVLVIASIWSWAIIINKLVYFRSIRKKHKKFEKYLRSNNDFASIFEAIKENISAPAEYIFYRVFHLIKLRAPKGVEQCSEDQKVKTKDEAKELVSNLKEQFIGEWENDLGYLATISSAAPFIGLFGTVWGIMRSFQAIAFAKNTSLAVVAPGIAEALFATALGLVAAIPALIFYNILLNKIGSLEREINDLETKLIEKLKTFLSI